MHLEKQSNNQQQHVVRRLPDGTIIDDRGSVRITWHPDREFPEIEGNIFSTVLSCVPGANHTHLNRLQMVSNFLKQAIGLRNAETPLLRTPYWRTIGRNSTIYAPRARCDGKVIAVTADTILIECTSATKYQNKFQLIELNPAPLMKPLVKQYDTVKAGQVVAKHVMLDDDYIPKLGVHLNTVWSFAIGEGKDRGLTFEDAIVLSESGAKKLTSYEIKSYFIEINKPYIEINPELKVGAILEKNTWLVKQYESIVSMYPESEVKLTNKSYIYSIYVFLIDEDWLNNLGDDAVAFLKSHSIQAKTDKLFEYLCEQYKTYYEQEFGSTRGLKGKCKELYDYLLLKQKSIMHHGRRGSALRAIIIINALQVNPIIVGDKLANRYGNKGVVSAILPDESVQAYLKQHSINVPDSFIPDIIVDTYGVHSRMNPMQLAEMILLYMQINTFPKIVADIKRKHGSVAAFKWLLDNVIGYLSEQYRKDVQEIVDSDPDPEALIEQIIDDIIENGLVLELNPIEYDLIYKTYKLAEKYAPEVTINLKELLNLSPVERVKRLQKLFGYGIIYWMKLEHRAEKKIKVVGSGPYNSKNGNPTEGYRFGEMETWTLFAHDALNTLQEFMTIRADDHTAKRKVLSDIIKYGESTIEHADTGRSQAFELFAEYMNVIGIDLFRLVRDFYYKEYLEKLGITDNSASTTPQIDFDLKQLVDKSLTYGLTPGSAKKLKELSEIVLGEDTNIDELIDTDEISETDETDDDQLEFDNDEMLDDSDEIQAEEDDIADDTERTSDDYLE